MNYLLPFLSVIAGYGVALLLQPHGKQNLKLLLAFSGSFLLSLTVVHLLPEVYGSSGSELAKQSHNTSIGIFIMVGILFQIILEFFSQGAEHGHVHGHEKMTQIPWLLFISLCLHALMEGLPVSRHPDLAIGIAIHHLPIAIILSTFFINGNLSKTAIGLFMFTFAIMTPLGTAISIYLPIVHDYYDILTAIVIGILFHISSTIIFESSEGHKFNIAKITMIILGILLAYWL